MKVSRLADMESERVELLLYQCMKVIGEMHFDVTLCKTGELSLGQCNKASV